METTVVNIRIEKCDEYIGRKKEGMHYGNPFSHLKKSLGQITVASRVEAIVNFKLWIHGIAFHDVETERRKWILQNLQKLKGKKLGCFCKPADCHGDEYVEILENNLSIGV